MSGECNVCGEQHSEFECLMQIAEELASQLSAWKSLYDPSDPDSNAALQAFEDFKKNVSA